MHTDRVLFVVCFAVGITTIATTALPNEAAPLPAVCTTPECYKAALMIKESMDTTVKPCDNFYNYVCGNAKPNSKWIKDAPGEDLGDAMYLNNLQATGEMLERINNGSQTLESPWNREVANKAFALYKSCLDYPATNHSNMAPLRQHLDKMAQEWGDKDALIALSSSSLVDSDAYQADGIMKALATMHSLGISPLFEAYASFRDGPTARLILKPLQDGTYERWNDPDYQQAMTTAIRRVFSVAGDAATAASTAPQTAVDWTDIVKRVLLLESKIDTATKPWPVQDDPTNSTELNVPGLPLVPFVELLLDKLHTNVSFTDIKGAIMLRNPSYFREVGQVLTEAGAKNVKAFLMWQTALHLAPYYDAQLKELLADYSSILSFEGDLRLTCARLVEDAMPYVVTRLFVTTRFQAQDQARLDTIVSDVYTKFAQLIHDSSAGTDNSTRDYFRAQVAGLQHSIGEVTFAEDPSNVATRYAGLHFNRTDMLENWLPFLAAQERVGWQYLETQPSACKGRVPLCPTAVYDMPNDLCITPALAQHPYYSSNQPWSLNYGSIGSILGSGMGGAVTESTSQVTPGGNMVSTAIFADQKTCLLDQFNGTYALDRLSSYRRTWLFEEVVTADVGIRAAWDAWHARRVNTTLTSSEAADADARLPGLDHSPEQLFFLALAQQYCIASVPTKHVPVDEDLDQDRPTLLNIAMQSLEQFAAAFNCPAGSPMAAKKESCRIW
ncbi:hypothetical protein RI367_008607 [Sorochytrium milnesiophthora]